MRPPGRIERNRLNGKPAHSPLLAAGSASEYDKEDILPLRYPAVLLQGSSFLYNTHHGRIVYHFFLCSEKPQEETPEDDRTDTLDRTAGFGACLCPVFCPAGRFH